MQQGKPHGKWKERARVGVYLGQSPHHNKNVALVLDRNTGYVSPQFHVRFDNQFDSVTDDKYDSEWKLKTGLISISEKELERRDKMPTIIPGINRQSVNPEDNIQEGEVNERIHEYRKETKSILKNKQRSEYRDMKMLGESTKRKSAHASRMEEPADKRVRIEDRNYESIDGLRRSARLNPKLQEGLKLISLQTKMMEWNDDVPGEIFHKESLIVNEPNIVAMKATSDPDTMYMHQAMREDDRANFIEAMHKEVKDQYQNGNFEIVHKKNVPKDATILPTVWQMRRKRDIKTRQVKKYKARLNIDGSRMRKGVHYDETYAPVASWNSIRVLLTLVAALGWHTQQIDYVLAFPQAPVEKELFMYIPKGFELTDGNPSDYVLKLKRNIYGQKQAGRVWNKYLERKLIEEVGFKKSKVDECVFYKGKTMYILYTDDSILAGPSKDEIESIIDQIKKAKLDITREGNIQDFLGINIQPTGDGKIELTQPHLIDQILKDLRLDGDEVKTKDIPSMASKVLSEGRNSKEFDGSFHYQSVIGKLNYLEKGTRADISYITHQCAIVYSCSERDTRKSRTVDWTILKANSHERIHYESRSYKRY